MKRLIAVLLVAGLLSPLPVLAQDSGKISQFAYVLRLVPRLYDDKAWTDADSALVGKHFMRLKELNAQGKVIFAGRSLNDAKHTFGLVVLEGMSESEARAIMLADDAVAGGVMTAELVPFSAVLERYTTADERAISYEAAEKAAAAAQAAAQAAADAAAAKP